MSINEATARWVAQYVGENPNLSADQLNLLLRRLGIWRSTLIANTYVQHHGLTIGEGPFAGMTYVAAATEGALAPRLIGAYERELHPHILAFAAQGFDCVIDIGCAEGYYAVGLARLMPAATVQAYDINERARAACAQLAAANGVGDRVVIGELFTPADFAGFAGRRCLVMVDAEGAEDDLLDPAVSPALSGMSLIVETHDLFRAGVKDRLLDRFAATHDITVVGHAPNTTPLPPWLEALNHMDRLMAVWEWRSGPTPWLVMRPKAR
jgi:precorrin-6B methylase 2